MRAGLYEAILEHAQSMDRRIFSGRELLGRLREKWPGLPGHALNEALAHFAHAGRLRRLSWGVYELAAAPKPVRKYVRRDGLNQTILDYARSCAPAGFRARELLKAVRVKWPDMTGRRLTNNLRYLSDSRGGELLIRLSAGLFAHRTDASATNAPVIRRRGIYDEAYRLVLSLPYRKVSSGDILEEMRKRWPDLQQKEVSALLRLLCTADFDFKLKRLSTGVYALNSDSETYRRGKAAWDALLQQFLKANAARAALTRRPLRQARTMLKDRSPTPCGPDDSRTPHTAEAESPLAPDR